VQDYWWILFTVAAAAGQTARNAMQRGLTKAIGTAGATHARFLFGLPFALLFFIAVNLAVPGPVPHLHQMFFGWVVFAAVAQIVATALLLAAMQERSFVVSVAYSKTEPVQVALFGTLFLGDHLTGMAIAAVIVATLGVLIMSWRGGAGGTTLRPALLGIASGAGFAFAAVFFRGAIKSLDGGSFVLDATTTLFVGLLIQTLMLSAWLLLREPQAMRALIAHWRQSLPAGFLGAAASQMWFLAFALETAARVRTLGLVEILFAQIVSMQIIREGTRWQDVLGIALVVAGVAVILMGW
jgi:drug/metabolite transporter (DMT)-like permease